MKQTATLELYAYWDALRGERAAPERRDIDPTAIRGALADTFILEVDPQRTFPFRLVGTRLDMLLLEDMTGRSFLSLWPETARAAMAAVLERLCQDARPIVADVGASVRDEAIALELLLLPLRHGGRTHARILGCLAPARFASWVGVRSPQALELGMWRAVLPWERRSALLGRDRAPDAPTANVVRHGHLAVHNFGD